MSKYTTLLFDADATLLDFKRSETEAVIECLNTYGLPSTPDVIEKYSQINAEYWKMLERGEIEKEKLYIARWQTLIDFYGFDCSAEDIGHDYPERLAEKSYVLDGAVELCESLHGKFSMYIVTNGQKMVQQKRLFPSPVFKYFDKCFISEDMGHEKPSVKYFEKVIEQIPQYDPEKTIIIGDSLTSDMQGGINIGIDTCWYNPSGKEKPCNMNITYVAKSFEEIANILLK